MIYAKKKSEFDIIAVGVTNNLRSLAAKSNSLMTVYHKILKSQHLN